MFKRKCSAIALTTILIVSTILTGCSSGGGNTEIVRKTSENNQVVVELESPTPVPSEAPEEVTPTPEPEEIEEPPVEEAPMDDISMYYAFLGMGDSTDTIKAVVDEGVEVGYFDYEHENIGKEFSLDEIENELGLKRSVGGDDNLDKPHTYFSFIERGDKLFLVLNLKGVHIDGPDDDSETTFIIVRKDDGLHITHSFSEWSRNEASINTAGFIYSSGSAGAGEQISTGGILTDDGEYKEVYFDDQVYEMWMRASDDTVAKCYDEVYTSYDVQANVYLNVITMGDDKYYRYSNFIGELTKEDKLFIQKLEENGIEWTDEEDFNEIVERKIYDLTGISGAPSESAIIFTPFSKGEDCIIPVKVTGDTAFFATKDSIGEEIEPSKKLRANIKKAGNSVVEDGLEISDRMLFTDAPSEDDELIHIDTVKNGKETFKYYISVAGWGLFETPDGKYVYIKEHGMIDFIYGTVPTFTIDDFDGDGESELLVEYYIFHGTGFMQQSAAMLDQTTDWDGDKSWHLYNLTPKTYVEAAMNHIKVADMGQELKVNLDGNESAVSKDADEGLMKLYADCLVKITHEGKDIIVETSPVVYGNNNPMGYELETFKMKFEFKSEGYWKEKD